MTDRELIEGCIRGEKKMPESFVRKVCRQNESRLYAMSIMRGTQKMYCRKDL